MAQMQVSEIITEPRFIEGHYIKPCLGSGRCCIQSPCGYGEWNSDSSACRYLEPPNEIGMRGCGRYEWIVENVPDYQFYPAFGSGCGSGMFNTLRDAILARLPEDIRSIIK